MNTVSALSPRAALVENVLLRIAGFAGIWWLLTGGDGGSWLVGIPVVLLTLMTSLSLSPPPSLRISPTGALLFFGFFLAQSIKGGLQVALIALHPRMDVQPTELDVPLRLAHGPGQLLLAGTISLMPGTLAVGIEDGRLHLHVLDRRIAAESELRATEARIARMIGEVLP